MESDRAEMNDLASGHPDRVKSMADQWQRWAAANDVFPLGAWKTTMDEDHKAKPRRKAAAKKDSR